MPYTADVDTTASKVVKGDHIRIIAGNRDYAVLVETVKVGVKWTEARDAEGKLIFRKLNDDQTWAMREVLTEEEEEAKREAGRRAAMQFRIDRLTTMHARMHMMIHVAKEALISSLQNDGYVSANAMENVTIAQEYKTIACVIDQILSNETADDNMNIIEAMEYVADDIKERIIEGHGEPTYSGGFTFTNAERQTRIAAQRKFIQGINWGNL